MRNILVTGGTRGLGLTIAKTLAVQGYRVVSIARSRNDAFDEAVIDAKVTGKGELAFAAYDLADIDGISALVRDLRSTHGTFYGLVNNAGLGTHGVLATMRNKDIERLVRINTVAPLVLTKHMVRHMMADGGGRIVNVASIVASTGFRAMSAYAATKASMIGFTRSLAREVGAFGICVNAVAPGFLATDMTESLGETDVQQITRRSALRRLAETEDVAEAVAFLMGKGGRNITGTVLTVDAGNTA